MKAPKPLKIAQNSNYPSWFNSLLDPFNQFFAQVYNNLNNITIGDNLLGKFVTQSFTTGATYTSGVFPDVSFSADIKKIVESCQIAQISRDDGIIITDVISVPQWNFTNGTCTINYIAGLDNSTKYTVRFLIL